MTFVRRRLTVRLRELELQMRDHFERYEHPPRELRAERERIVGELAAAPVEPEGD